MSIQCCYYRKSQSKNPGGSFADPGVLAVSSEVNPILELPYDFQTRLNAIVGCLKLRFTSVTPDPAIAGGMTYEWVLVTPPFGYKYVCKNTMTLEVIVAGDPDPVVIMLLESDEFRP